MSTVKVNISGVGELDFPAGVSSATVLNGVATINLAGGSGSGTVTSVGLTGDGTIFNATVAGSPVTSAGTLVPALLTQAANKVLVGPTSGLAANPTFRLLVAGDIPNLPASIITTGQLALARGGTNADLSSTGGASQVLKQVSVGAAITVGQLAASDLSNGVTGSGAVVLATSATLVTPTLGVASATSLAIGAQTLQSDTGRYGTGAIRVQSTGTNAPGVLTLMPSGTSTEADIRMYNASDPANTGAVEMSLVGTTMTFTTEVFGTGNKPTTVDLSGFNTHKSAPLITTATTQLQLQETGDALGKLNLYLRNRSGSNGAVFENPSVCLTDFGMQTSAIITNIAIDGSNNLTVTAVFASVASSLPSVGQKLTLSGLTTATFLNGQVVTIATISATQFTATFTHALYASAPDTGIAVAQNNVRAEFRNDKVLSTLNTSGEIQFFDPTNPGAGTWFASGIAVTNITGNALVAGKIGVGTSPPSATLGIGGDGFVSSFGTNSQFESNDGTVRGLTGVQAFTTGGYQIGTTTSHPIRFYVGSSQAVTITNTSLLLTGLASINAVTGFQFNGTAPTGNVLRGNGTNFVSATLAFSDLSGSAVAAQIPSLDASKITTGLLALARGGTNADLSATGGTSQVLKQVSVGGAVTVGQLAASDLSNGVTGSGAVVLATAPTITSLAMSGKLTTYNNIVTVGNGTPSEVAIVALTAQAAAKATTTLYAVPASGAGQYNVNWNAKVTRAATTSSTLGALTITYTDPDGVAVTLTALAQTAGGVASTTNTANSTTAALYGQLTINCKASTNITYAFAYVSSGTTTMQYNLNIVLEAL